jgi:tetratricopeptide (TPR) repeat protein
LIEAPKAVDFISACDLAVGKILAGDYDPAYEDLTALTADVSFADAPPEIRYGSLVTLGILEANLGSPEKAVELVLSGGEVTPELRDAWYWETFAQIAGLARDDNALVAAATALAIDYPDVLKSWDTARFFGVLNIARSLDDEPARIRLFETLWTIGYEPKAGGYPMDVYWLELMASYAAREEWDKAQAIAESLDTADGLATLAYDKRFYRFAPSDLDAAIEAIKESAIVAARAAVSDNPHSLEALIVLTQHLKSAGRFEEGLKVVDDALAAIAAAPAGGAFKDEVRFGSWLYGHRAMFLTNLGRFDEALAVQIQAYDAAVAANADAVSQGLNLAQFYLQLDRPADALETIGKISEVSASEYGRVVGGAISACALEAQGKHDEASTLVETLVPGADKGFSPLMSALLCLNDLDRLAKITIEQLGGQATRSRTLKDQQRYREGALTAQEMTLRERQQRLLARPDMVEAIANVGKILDLPIYD